MEELKQRIILETTKLVADHGIKAIRMDDIASHMGISKRTLYEVFGDKEALIIDCIIYIKDGAEQKSREIMAKAGNVIEEFILLFEYWETNVEGSNNIMLDIKRIYPKIYDEVMDRQVNQSFDKLKAELQRGVGAG